MKSREELIADAWPKAQRDIETLQRFGAKRLFAKSGRAQEAFRLSNRCLVCGDEGIPFGIHSPGSGVLMPADIRRQEIRAAGITEFTTHDNCGAFRLAFPNIANHNLAVQTWGREQAQELGLPYRHISASEMSREPELHHATVIYYDGTGLFNPIAELPVGFVISRKYFSDSSQMLERYIGIAFKDGFGDLFTRSTPLGVVVIGTSHRGSLSGEELISEISGTVRSFGGRVALHSVSAFWYLSEVFQRELASV